MQIRSRATKGDSNVGGASIDNGTSFDGTALLSSSRRGGSGAAGARKHNSVRGPHRKSRPVVVPGWQVCAGCVLTVVLVIFISGVDFQRDGGATARSDNPNGVLLRSVARDSAATTADGAAALGGSGGGTYPALRRNATASGSVCRYDGHCGVGHTCAVAPNGNGGTCEPFAAALRNPPPTLTSSQAPSECVASCLRELRIDEHWYHESWPVVEWTEDVTSARGRPNPGCLVVYHREPQGDHFAYLDEQDRKEKWTEVPPSLKDWVKHRFRHVVRVDPFSPDPTDRKWTALCHGPCHSDADCGTTNDGPTVPGYVCREGTCGRNPSFWGPDLPTQDTPRSDMPAAANMVLVTGATSGYLSGLTNLVASARYWAPQYKVVVYNLGGMTEQDVARIRSWSNVLAVEWVNGVPAHYPPHVHEGKIYAWKPIIVNETVHKYGSIFWLDSGSTLAGPVQPVQEALQKYGIALMKGQDLDMRPKAHEKAFEWFGYNKQSMSWGPHFSGNTQAFLYPSRYTDSVVIPNCKCALDRACIAPPGSGLTNHRYDQTTISILAYAPKVRLPHYTEFLAAQSNQLNPNLLEPSFKLVWTARQGCQFYTNRDPELRGQPPDGGYYHYLPDDPTPGGAGAGAPGAAVSSSLRVAAAVGGAAKAAPPPPPDRHHLYVGPNSLEGGDMIPDHRAAALQSIHGGGHREVTSNRRVEPLARINDHMALELHYSVVDVPAD